MWTITFGNQTFETAKKKPDEFWNTSFARGYQQCSCWNVCDKSKLTTHTAIRAAAALSIRRFAVNRCFPTLVRGQRPFCSSGCLTSNIFSTAKDHIRKRVVDKLLLVVRQSVWWTIWRKHGTIRAKPEFFLSMWCATRLSFTPTTSQRSCGILFCGTRRQKLEVQALI